MCETSQKSLQPRQHESNLSQMPPMKGHGLIRDGTVCGCVGVASSSGRLGRRTIQNQEQPGSTIQIYPDRVPTTLVRRFRRAPRLDETVKFQSPQTVLSPLVWFPKRPSFIHAQKTRPIAVCLLHLPFLLGILLRCCWIQLFLVLFSFLV